VTTEQPPVTPLPTPPEARELLLFGGLFDPPHWAHVELAIAARDAAMGPEAWLVYIPAAASPHKPGGAVASAPDRLAMLQLAIEGRARTAIWTDELDRAGPSYWVDTLRRARGACDAQTEIRFLIGADQAVAFHRWRAFREILTLAAPVVMLREPAPTVERLRALLRETGAWSREEIEAWVSWTVGRAALSMSSTQVRESVGAGFDDEALDDRVRDYIASHGLYSERP
jgi:nicotinate-nucleotide adenylyltransferase